MRSGFVPVVGRPNVGKSTLVNALVGKKVTITSTKPQTTRNSIRGVVNLDDCQMVLVDTPGLHKPRNQLGNRLNASVHRSLTDADAVLFVIDATAAIGPGDRRVAEMLVDAGVPVVVAMNKTDAATRNEVLTQLEEAGVWGFAEYVPVSARDASNLDSLTHILEEMMPEGPAYFPLDATSDQPEHRFIAEVVREKFLDRLNDELPHSLAVVVDDIGEGAMMVVNARVIVERDSQKGIVIGSRGSMLGTAGTEARVELERVFGCKVHLALRVVVEPEWQRRPDLFDRLGFTIDG